MSLYGNGVGRLGNEADVIPSATLRDYIAYARATCQPQLAPEAANALSQHYVEMRSMGMSRKTVSATPRQLESLIRLSGASAGRRVPPRGGGGGRGHAQRLLGQAACEQAAKA